MAMELMLFSVRSKVVTKGKMLFSKVLRFPFTVKILMDDRLLLSKPSKK